MDGNRSPEAAVTLLYVEDEEITRETVCSLLKRRFPKLVVQSAANGAQGWELFRTVKPDLVLTDIKMPVLNGIEMSRLILEQDKDVPIIVASAHSDLDYLTKSIEIGISRYLLKPIESGKLFAAVEACLASLRVERELQAQHAQVRLLNQTLSERAKELEIANRDLESFSYTVSHDLRAPLTNINGYCQLILELFGPTLDEQCKSFVEVILGETVSMNELIRTLLDFSKLSRAEISRSRTDLSEMAAVIAAGLRMREPEREVEFAIEPALAAEGDPDLLRVVLDNLLSNAHKYSARKEKALIEFGAIYEGEQRTFFVRDNGAGFDMALDDKLFTPFQRLHTDGEFKGFGIGLATVQRIIQRHGGKIWAEGRVGEGATFYFTLPPNLAD